MSGSISFYCLLLHSQIPLSTTNFVFFHLFSNGLIIATIHFAPCLDVCRGNIVSIQILKGGVDVVDGESHLLSFQQSYYRAEWGRVRGRVDSPSGDQLYEFGQQFFIHLLGLQTFDECILNLCLCCVFTHFKFNIFR